MRKLILFLAFYYPSVEAIEINDQAVSCLAIMESDNTQLNLGHYLGHVIYLDFWATWCPPCKKSMPFLNSLRNELHNQGFEIIAVNVDENSDDARRFLQKFPVDYPIVMDPSGHCPKKYDVMAMPSAYLIDRQGKIRFIHLGFRNRDKQKIRQQILALLSERGGQ